MAKSTEPSRTPGTSTTGRTSGMELDFCKPLAADKAEAIARRLAVNARVINMFGVRAVGDGFATVVRSASGFPGCSIDFATWAANGDFVHQSRNDGGLVMPIDMIKVERGGLKGCELLVAQRPLDALRWATVLDDPQSAIIAALGERGKRELELLKSRMRPSATVLLPLGNMTVCQ